MKTLLFCILCASLMPHMAVGQALLQDKNGDGVVSLLAFGDSITRGIGDGLQPGITAPEDLFNYVGAGYPGRLEALLHVPTDNEGVPGEEFTTAGIFRLPSSVGRSPADIILLYEGVNDASRSVGDGELERLMQRAINTIRILGKEPLLGTFFAPTEDHSSIAPIVAAYNVSIRQLATANDLAIIDYDRAWKTTCQNKFACELYNLPDGLHPNTRGYRVMAEVASATLLGIDIFASTGASELAGALGVPATEIVTKPDVTRTTP